MLGAKIKFLLLALAVLGTGSVRAEPFAQGKSSDGTITTVLVADNPETIREAERQIIAESERLHVPVVRILLEGKPFEQLPAQDAEALLRQPTEVLPEPANVARTPEAQAKIDAEVERYRMLRRVLVVARAGVIGTTTGVTMALGALQQDADPYTVAVAGTIGALVGGGYSAVLQTFNKDIARWITKDGFLRIDPEKPASLPQKVIKQMVVPIGLGFLMNVAKATAERVFPGVQFNHFFEDPRRLGELGQMAGLSAYFQLPWQLNNEDIYNKEMKEAGADPVARERAEFHRDLRVLGLAVSLSVTNAIQLSGLKGAGAVLSGIVGSAGIAVRRLFFNEPEAAKAVAQTAPSAGAEACAKGYEGLSSRTAAARDVASVKP